MVNVTMSGEKEIIVADCTAAIASSLGAESLLAIGRKWNHSTWVKKYIQSMAENSTENVTLCYRNLQLLKYLRMN